MLSISWVKRSSVSQIEFMEVKKKVFHFPLTSLPPFYSFQPSLISEIWSLNHRIWRKVHRIFLMRPDCFARHYWEKNRKSTIKKTTCTWKNYDASCRSKTEKIPLAMSSGWFRQTSSSPQRTEPQDLYQLVPTHDSLAEGEKNANTQRQYYIFGANKIA